MEVGILYAIKYGMYQTADTNPSTQSHTCIFIQVSLKNKLRGLILGLSLYINCPISEHFQLLILPESMY